MQSTGINLPLAVLTFLAVMSSSAQRSRLVITLSVSKTISASTWTSALTASKRPMSAGIILLMASCRISCSSDDRLD